MVLINRPHSCKYFLPLFRKAGVTLLLTYEFASTGMRRSMVVNGHGLSVLTTRPVVLSVRAGHASPLVALFLQVARAVMAP
ncbi:hypothetical protein [Delftia sp. PS-11]|uniref:hypothetical protein n=1 Tax=Delftia sp. PS-11 TaxID=2767222 RepID=UPI0024575D28|nr:hypothetical protein [Delftia sp. PS-11]